MDGTVALFDAASGKLLHTLAGHFKPVRDLCFTPGGCAGQMSWNCCANQGWRLEVGFRLAGHFKPVLVVVDLMLLPPATCLGQLPLPALPCTLPWPPAITAAALRDALAECCCRCCPMPCPQTASAC